MLNGTLWQKLGLELCIAVRILHWHFAATIDYKEFKGQLLEAFEWSSIRNPVHFALRAVAKDLGGTVESPIVLVVAMDEYHRVDEEACIVVNKTNTQAIYSAFTDLMTTGSKPYVFCPVFVVLVQQPLVNAERASKVKFVPLPLHCLSMVSRV